MNQTQLNKEVQTGKEYQRVFDKYIKPFISEKKQVLFEAFENTSLTDADSLLNIRMQLQALKGLENEFGTYINSGKLAAQQIKDSSDE